MPEENNNTSPVSLEPTEPVLETVPEPATSEKPKKKSSSAYITAVIVLAIFALAGIGFGVYAWFFRPTDQVSSTCECEKCEECGKCKECAENESECPKCEDALTYAEYLENLASNEKFSYIETELLPHNINIGSGAEAAPATEYYRGHIQNDHLILTRISHDGKSETLYEQDNVVYVYAMKRGAAGIPYFYYIDKEGNVSGYNTDSRSIVKIAEPSAEIIAVQSISHGNAVLLDMHGVRHSEDSLAHPID